MSKRFKNQSVIDAIRKWKDFLKIDFFFVMAEKMSFLPGKVGVGQWSWLVDGVERIVFC